MHTLLFQPSAKRYLHESLNFQYTLHIYQNSPFIYNHYFSKCRSLHAPIIVRFLLVVSAVCEIDFFEESHYKEVKQIKFKNCHFCLTELLDWRFS